MQHEIVADRPLLRATTSTPLTRSRMSPPRRLGLRRPRLTRALATRPRLGLLVAPAGSGKTEVMAQAASAFPGTVAWYRATADDVRRDAVLACLEQTLTSALGMLPTGW